jgi:transposase InsO family protein
MRDAGLAGHRPGRRRSLTRCDETAAPIPDRVGRLFDPDRLDDTSVGDITYVPTAEGWLYVATVIDLGSRRLLGWSMSDHQDTRLVVDALEAAVAARGRTRMDGTTFHSDRGAEGGLKRPSQHLELRSCDGTFCWMGVRADRATATAVPGSSTGVARRGPRAVLVGDR